MVFEGLIAGLAGSGILGIYLPFLVMFSIFFALIQKTKIFGDAKRINVLISFVAALYVVAFSPFSMTIGQWFATLFATTGVVLVSVIVLFIVVAMIIAPWWSDVLGYKKIVWILGPIALLVGFLILTAGSFGTLPGGTISIPGLTSEDIVFLALVIITVIVIIYLIGGSVAEKAGMVIPLLDR